MLALTTTVADESLPSNSDVAIVQVHEAQGRWSYVPHYQLVENAAEVLDVCPANLAGARGLMVLYRLQLQTTLQFVGFPGKFGSKIVRDLVPQQDSRCIATFTNQDGFTDTIVGGNGLYHFTAQESRTSGSKGTLMSSFSEGDDGRGTLKGLQQLQVAVAGDVISVWFENGNADVGYQAFDRSMKPRCPPTELLPQEQGGGVFSALLGDDNRNTQLFIAGTKGRLQRLEHKGLDGDWSPATDIIYPSLTNTVTVLSYTIQIHVKSVVDGLALQGRQLRISTERDERLIINGAVKLVGPSGILVSTDATGAVTVIQQSEDLASAELTVKDQEDAATMELVIEPASKARDKISQIASSEHPEDHPLFKASTASPDDVKKGIIAFKGFNEAFKTTGDSSNILEPATIEGTDTRASPMTLTDVETLTGVAGGGLWHWVTTQLGKLADVVVTLVQGAWRVVVYWAEKAWSFVLKTGTHVLKAVKWLLQDVLKIPIQAILDAIGFLFAWGDICDTHDLLVYAANAGLDWAAEGVDIMAEAAGYCFEGMKESIRDFVTPEGFKDESFSNEGSKTSGAHSDVMQSPGGSWGSYQIQHGGASSTGSGPETGVLSEDCFSGVSSIIKDIIQDFQRIMPKISERLGQVQNARNKLSIGDVLKLVGGEIALAFVDGTEKIVVGLLKGLAGIIHWIKAGMNATVQIPLISKLYKDISGNDLSALDAIALLIAIPVTIIFKAVHGKRPRDVPEIAKLLEQIKGKRSDMSVENTYHSIKAQPMQHLKSSAGTPESMHQGKQADDTSLTGKMQFTDALNVAPAARRMKAVRDHQPAILLSSQKTVVWGTTSAVGASRSPKGRPSFPEWILRNLEEWWHKFWSSPIAYIKDIIGLGAIVGNIYTACTLLTKIKDTTAQALQGPVRDGWFWLGLGINIVVFIGSCPIAPWIKAPIPRAWLRGISWGIGAINIGCCWLGKFARSCVSLAISVLQAIMDTINLVWDWFTDIKDFPNRPEGAMMVTHSLTVLLSHVGKISGGIALVTTGTVPYSSEIAVVAAGLTPVVNLATYMIEDKQKHVHVISLLGL